MVCGRSSGVEHYLAKVRVGRSNRLARSIHHFPSERSLQDTTRDCPAAVTRRRVFRVCANARTPPKAQGDPKHRATQRPPGSRLEGLEGQRGQRALDSRHREKVLVDEMPHVGTFGDIELEQQVHLWLTFI